MAELFECLGYVPWHRKMNFYIFVVPFQSDAKISCLFVIKGDFKMLIEALQ